jgi:predicted Rossmann fold flavoprotein
LAGSVLVVGGGAAGLATAIFTRRLAPDSTVRVLEGARKPGAKILVSGGSRCNVTNARVTERDFWGGKRTIIRRVLQALTVPQTVEFFAGLGVSLHEEAHGKLFPDTNRSRDVLDALLREAERSGAALALGARVTEIERLGGRFLVETSTGRIEASTVVLATGGQSLPKSGSDGTGYELARRLGHTIVPPVPALVPLLLADTPEAIHRDLTGVSHDADVEVWVDGSVAVRLTGALLWTHFGASGPVVLDASRHWTRATQEGRAARVAIGFCPGDRFEHVDARLAALADARGKASLAAASSSLLPASVGNVLARRLGLDTSLPLARLTRADRRRIAHALAAWPLAVVGTRGYNYAEATAGGVALDEIDPATMESRRCPGLFLVGEILDADGRIGGFNFQWAWSSARAAATGIAARRARVS